VTRRPVDAPEHVTAEDVCYFRVLVACLEHGGESVWDLPCARLALAAVERRWAAISGGRD
jgi:hypothetical protein